MDNQKFITHIRDHIANNQLDTALQLLRDLLDNSPQLDEVIQQAGRYASIRQQIRLGIVSHTDATLTENQIRMGLIDLLGEIKKQGKESRLREEMERAISIVNSKNVVFNSNITAGGDVTIGDKKIEHHTTIINNEKVSPKSSITTRRVLIGVALLLLIGFLTLGIWTKDTPKQQTEEDPIFKENNENFKILILPFKSFCKYDGKQYDAGEAIKEHLQGIAADESLKITASYFEDYDFKNFNDIKAKELQKYHYADMIVFGTYQTDDCSEGEKICVNFMTDQKWNLGEMSSDLDRTYESGGLDELQRGEIQKKVEDIATFLSVISQQKNIEHERYMGILQDFLKLKDAGNYSKASVYGQLADQLKSEGKLDEVLDLYQKALDIYEAENDKRSVGVCYERIGSIHKDLGELDKALKFFEQYNELEKQLNESYPRNTDFKYGLAISYGKLGETYSALGNFDKAFKFFEQFTESMEQLCQSYPKNVDFKRELASSYSKLGRTYNTLGDIDKALKFFGLRSELGKQLYESYPHNVDFKRGLAISYQDLGEIQSSLGNLEKALTFFENYAFLAKELHKSYSHNVDFKRGLAISYAKLGETHSALGNLDKALKFFENETVLFKQLYESYPKNVGFKNGLAVSYAKLGVFSKNQLKDNKKAKVYFQQAHDLWKELTTDYPVYVEFQRSFKEVKNILEDLSDCLSTIFFVHLPTKSA